MYARTIGDLVCGEIVRNFESDKHVLERTYEITHQNLIEAVIDNKTGNKTPSAPQQQQHPNNENYKFDNSNIKSKISRIMTEMDSEKSRSNVYSPISRPNSTETNSASSQPPPPPHSPHLEGLAYPRAKSPGGPHRQAAPPTCALPTVQLPRTEYIESYFMENKQHSSKSSNLTRSSTIVPVPPNNAGPSDDHFSEGLLARFAKPTETKLKEEFNHSRHNDCLLLKREAASAASSSTTVVKMERAATPDDPTELPPSRPAAKKRSSSTAPSSPPSKMPSNESQDSSNRLNHAPHEPPLPPLPPPPPPNSSAPPLPTPPPPASAEEDGELIL